MKIHIHAPPCQSWSVRRKKCPTCKNRQRLLMEYYEWYGASVTCLKCGEMWQDGEMCERPFKPGWRKERVAAAKKWIKQRTLTPTH